MISVVSYNILTNVYSIIGPKGYSKDHYGINYFKYDIRLQKIKNVLLPFMEKDTVICLQEVDIPFSEDLQVFFTDNNYNFYYHPYVYGMGIATAVPTKFRVEKIYRYNPVEEEYPKDINMKVGHSSPSWPKPPQMTWTNWAWRKMGYKIQDYASYKNFIYRKNYTLFLDISIPVPISTSGYEFSASSSYLVGNIHMPCQYQEPSFMEAYLYLIRAFIEKLHSTKQYRGDYILAGDFNSQPGSLAYEMMKKGQLSNTTINWIRTNFPSEAWHKFGFENDAVNTMSHMKSALYFTGTSTSLKEPDFTCKSHSRGNDFIGCIDYIFISSGLTCSTGGVSTAMYNSNAYLPNSMEPSDHLPIYAEIETL